MVVSLVMLLIPHQIDYNIYKYKLENSVAKAKGMLSVLDVALMPTK